MSAKVRIGIDVGGTFTHAVAVSDEDLRLLGQVKVPTTHRAEEGVARGIVESLQALLSAQGISPDDVSFIAHSTTQATNALLEGDVAPVGVLGLGAGLEGARARTETRVGDIELAPGKALPTFHRFLDTSRKLDELEVETALKGLITEGARTIVAAGAFSVDDPSDELAVMGVAARLGLPATGTHEVSQLYGLKVRTRTAVVNACILPRMIETAVMTEKSVRAAGIKAPLMVMRSDGGVMSVDEVRRRPILTILSGPAAGVAAALMYVRISDGIFLEVGGTSTDISVIRDGRALVKSAEIGGHRLFLRTLDVRTIGVAGGSMPRVSKGAVHAVGPRSAHIAGLGYTVFTPEEELVGCEAVIVSPTPGDPDDYAVVRTPAGKQVAVTTTCAANILGFVPPGDYAEGNRSSATHALAAIGILTNQTSETAARSILRVACEQVRATVGKLVEEYRLDKSLVELIGGGGGAAVLVPFAASEMAMKHRLAENASVISAIGVALALVRDVIERTVPGPTEDDLLSIRRDAIESVIKLGAAPETVEVQIEIDSQRNILRAVATGSTEMRERDITGAPVSDEERLAIAAKSLHVPVDGVVSLARTGFHEVFGATIEERRAFGLLRTRRSAIRVLDRDGVVRLQRSNADVVSTTSQEALGALSELIERRTTYGDGGISIPDIFVLVGPRLMDFSGLATAGQLTSLVRVELEGADPSATVVLIAASSG